MITKRRLVLLSSLSSAPVMAAPFLAIGDNAELFITANGSVRHEDNVTLSDVNEKSDEIFTFSPGVELLFGKNSTVTGSLSAFENFVTYSDSTNLNAQNDNLLFKASYEGSKLNLDANLSYAELSQNTRDLAGAASSDRKEYVAGLQSSYSLTEKTSVSGGIDYSSTVYDDKGFADQERYSIPVNYYFAIRPKIDLSAGVSYTTTDIELGNDSEDYYFNVGARGEFTPKLSGSFNTGYTLREVDGADDKSTWGLQAGLNYEYSEKTSISLDLNRGFETGADASGIETTSANLSVSSQFNAAWSASAGVGYTMLDYLDADRDDDYVTGNLGLSYVYNANLTFNAAYLYADNNSSGVASAGKDFVANTYTLSASFRY